MSIETCDTVIIGAGPAGLSTACHLRNREYRLFEKEPRPGGLLRTEKSGAYQFDYGGHILHFQDRATRDWVKRLAGKELREHNRNAAIYSKGVLTDYPFQANTYGLPAKVIRDCVQGFVEAIMEAEKKTRKPGNFEDWIYYNFGKGIAENFMIPFNRKFWKPRLDRISTEWVDWSVPRPKLREVINGALGIQDKKFGYNTSFYYPARGGMQIVADALAKRVKNIELNQEVIAVHPKERRLWLANGQEIRYGKLISTMPLKELFARLQNAPRELKEAAKRLEHLSVMCVNLGVNGERISKNHWIYFPENKFIFYRAGFYTNLAGSHAKRQSVVLEITRKPGRMDGMEDEITLRAVRDFAKTGLLGEGHELEHIGWMKIPCAYVVYDKHRSRWVPRLLAYLRDMRIFSIGRYGSWEYSTTESALKQGKELALKISR